MTTISNIVYNHLNIDTQADTTQKITLEKGRCLGVYLVTKKIPNDEQDVFVKIGVNSSQGNVILQPTDFEDFTHKGGGYFAGMKQVNFQTDNNVFFVQITSEEWKNQSLKGQLIFVIEREE